MKKETQIMVYILCLILGSLLLVGCENQAASAFVAELPVDKDEETSPDDEPAQSEDEMPVVDTELSNPDDEKPNNDHEMPVGEEEAVPAFSDIVWTLPAKSPIAIEFGSDGQVHGNSGCNSFAGSYRTDGSQLEMSQLISTMMACEEEVNQREIEFLATLAAVSQYRLEMGQLVLSDTAGNDLLTFMADVS